MLTFGAHADMCVHAHVSPQDTTKVMNRDDITTELRTMSMKVTELRKTATKAKYTLNKQQLSRISSVRLSRLQSVSEHI